MNFIWIILFVKDSHIKRDHFFVSYAILGVILIWTADEKHSSRKLSDMWAFLFGITSIKKIL